MSVDGLQEYIENSYEELEEHFLTLKDLTQAKETEPLNDEHLQKVYKIALMYCNQWEKLQELL
jgi:hypothetical protein